MKPDLTADGARWTLGFHLHNLINSLPLDIATELSKVVDETDAPLDSHSLYLPCRQIATLSEKSAVAIGLPANAPFAFDFRLSGALGKPGATLSIRWLQPGRLLPLRDAESQGCWITLNDQRYRVPDPIYTALQHVEPFNACSNIDTDEQFRIWSRIRAALGDDQAGQLSDRFLRSFRVVTASCFTLGITTDAIGNIQIEPVLLTERINEDGVVENIRALTEADEDLFVQRLDSLRQNAPAFPMSQGLYVVVEPNLQVALSAVKALRAASPEKRKQAALHPEAVIREILDQNDDEPSLFIETEKFSERVLDVSDWVPPILPWIKIDSQKWAPPVDFGVRVNGVEIPLSPQQLDKACDDMRDAIEKGLPTVVVNGSELPAKAENLAALVRLKKSVEARGKPEHEQPAEADASIKVLVIETNFHDTGYSKVKVNPRPGKRTFPAAIKTSPKKHQEDGLLWLQNHWIEGSRGAMLCDDMGLGKTYQALAFCAWLSELKASGDIPNRPILLVAPVGLLRTWEGEMDTHLMQPGLGNLLRAYGEHLRSLKRGRHSDGSVGLDTAKLGSADIVLANYEAVSDYQLSFGAIQFSTVILDEAQKIKSPKARMTTAVKALNTDFMIAMTGTPVENRLADLWCIADAVQPGALGDLKKFSSTYETDQTAVQNLRNAIWQQEEYLEHPPKLLLRRLKTDKLEGLPDKIEHLIKVIMPQRQLEAYSRAIAIGEHQGPGGTLGMIQALRSISLHPFLTEGKKSSDGLLNVEDSARFTATFQILDSIHRLGEKALIFLESLDLQSVDFLPTLLQRRYGMPRAPMVINGEVSTYKRQDRVAIFQEGSGFDVMLLSPKAGGVGLTLTAANHVIHLSRWWNPAVEDQCSDRVYRIGQNKTVHVYYPMAVLPQGEEHSFDMQLQVLMNRKRQLAKNLLVSSAFTKADYQDLVSATSVETGL